MVLLGMYGPQRAVPRALDTGPVHSSIPHASVSSLLSKRVGQSDSQASMPTHVRRTVLLLLSPLPRVTVAAYSRGQSG